MRVFSTFTGIGGFEIGIQNAFNNRPDIRNGSEVLRQDITNTKEREVRFIGYSEVDKYAISVYERNYPDVKNYGDITKINAEELPDFDCLVGGFPCQAFSIAGRRGGFADTRGTLFFDLARILRAKRPRLFVFENVKGLLNHERGRTFATIIATIDELGYDCQWQVLNSKNFGVPQNRERVIIVGHLRGTPRPEVFPIEATGRTALGANRRVISLHNSRRTMAITDTVNSLSATYRGSPDGDGRPGIIQVNGRVHQTKRVYDPAGVSPSIDTAQGGGRQPKVLVREATKKGFTEAGVGDAINVNQPNSKTRRGRVSNVSPTLDTKMTIATLTEQATIRKLTPLECERLQGFPDNWTQYGAAPEMIKPSEASKIQVVDGVPLLPVSDTQRYKMCGNAVTTNVIEAVFERILA